MPKLTKETFVSTVRERSKHLGFLSALYTTLEEYQHLEKEAKGMVDACGKGCSMCCQQMVCVFVPEMEEIKRHVDRISPDTRKTMRDRAKPILNKWRAWFAFNSLRTPEKVRHPILLAQAWLGKPCPLLREDGACGVYDARPLVCRITSSSDRCTRVEHLSDAKHSIQMRLECEAWANDLLIEAVGGQGAQATPLHYFLTMIRYEL